MTNPQAVTDERLAEVYEHAKEAIRNTFAPDVRNFLRPLNDFHKVCTPGFALEVIRELQQLRASRSQDGPLRVCTETVSGRHSLCECEGYEDKPNRREILDLLYRGSQDGQWVAPLKDEVRNLVTGDNYIAKVVRNRITTLTASECDVLFTAVLKAASSRSGEMKEMK